MRPQSRFLAALAVVVPVVVVVALVATLLLNTPPETVPPLAEASSPPSATASGLSPTPSLPGQSQTPSTAPSLAPGADPLLGTDGRLTVLLLGSDSRPSIGGNRTDAIMVVSIDPTTGKSAAFSVPRDVADFPLPKSGTYGPKVTGLYQHLQKTTGGNGARAMKQAVGRAFGIEIDRYALIGFNGVTKLVGAVGGVDVTLDKPYFDPFYWVNAHHRGWGLPAGKSHLNAANALIFARSRKGDSDFGRAKRQLVLVGAALTKVRSRGVAVLPKIIQIAKDTVRTDLPLESAADLYDLYTTFDVGAAKQAVFGPRKFAVRAGGTDYRLVLNLCKKWIATNFPPARPGGTWTAS